MSATCPIDLRNEVRNVYSRAAAAPGKSHPFPVGRAFARNAGYPEALLATLPPQCFEAFCGASNVSVRAEIPAGATVLDLGCGSGLDSLIAAQKTGPSGKVIGVDFSDEMLTRARSAAAAAQLHNVEFQSASAEGLPLAAGSVDVALVNGIFNLNPARQQIFAELSRVLATGGTVFASEIVLREPWPLAGIIRTIARLPSSSGNWFA
jgi:SAM-dependent methyltransferase